MAPYENGDFKVRLRSRLIEDLTVSQSVDLLNPPVTTTVKPDEFTASKTSIDNDMTEEEERELAELLDSD